MGNSNGTLAEYWDAIESTPGLQGGFIWEWRDHGLDQTLPGRDRRATPTAATSATCPTTACSASTASRCPDRRPKPAHVRAHAPRRAGPRVVGCGGDRGRARGPGHAREPGRVPRHSAGCARPGRSAVDGEAAASGDCRCPRSRPGATAEVAIPRLPPPGRRRRRALADARASSRPRPTDWADAGLRGRLGAGAARRRGRRRARHRVPHHTRAGPATSRSTTRGTSSTPRSRRRRPCPSGARRPTTTGSAGWRPAGRRWGLTGADAPARRDRAGGRRRHRPRDLDDRDRHRDRAHAAALGRRRWPDPRRGVGRGAARRSTTCRGSARCSSSSAGHRARSSGSGAARTRRTRTAARGGRVGRWRSTVTDQLVALRPAAGERRPRRHPLVPSRRHGRRGSASTSTGRARSRPPTRRAADLDAAAHDVELRPRARDDRPPRRRPPRPGDRELRPGHARPYVLGGGTYRWAWTLRAEAAGCVTIHWDAAAREWHLENGRTSCAMRVLENGWLGHLHAGAPLDPRAGRTRHLGPVPFDGLHQPRRRAGGARGPGAGRRRLPRPGAGRRGPGRLDGPRPALRQHRIVPGKPALPDLPSTYAEADDEAETARGRPRRRADRPAVDRPHTLFADRPVVARSLTLANGGAAPLTVRCAMSAVLDLPDADWQPRHAERAPGPASGTSSTGPSSPAAVGRQPARGVTGHEHSPFLAAAPRRRRPRTPARRSA